MSARLGNVLCWAFSILAVVLPLYIYLYGFDRVWYTPSYSYEGEYHSAKVTLWNGTYGGGGSTEIPAIVAFPSIAIALYLIGLACRYVLNPEGKK